jgi:FHS family L-fucose permease-like MFS transporter
MFRLPRILETDDHKSGSYRQALQIPHLMLGAIGIFLYVGAEVAIGSYLVNYFLTLNVESLVMLNPWMRAIVQTLSGSDIGELSATRIAGTFVFFYWGGAMVGRFVGSGLVTYFTPRYVLAVFGLVAMALLGLTISTSGLAAMWTVLAVGLFNSIMFPTIFTLAIDGIGENTAQGSGILCTAIVGGAIIPPLYGALADVIGLQPAFILLIACYGYIVFYGLKGATMRGAVGRRPQSVENVRSHAA